MHSVKTLLISLLARSDEILLRPPDSTFAMFHESNSPLEVHIPERQLQDMVSRSITSDNATYYRKESKPYCTSTLFLVLYSLLVPVIRNLYETSKIPCANKSVRRITIHSLDRNPSSQYVTCGISDPVCLWYRARDTQKLSGANKRWK